jgi:hypothetical protein
MMGLGTTINTALDKVGFLFNNTAFNVTATGGLMLWTGRSAVRSIGKGIVSPFPTCKALYFTAATLSGVSCGCNSLCMFTSRSGINRYSVGLGSLGSISSWGASTCSSMADCMNPMTGLADAATNACIDAATKGF